MSGPGDASKQLDDLLAILNERELTASEGERLNALLRGDPALQGKFLDLQLLDAMLGWEQPTTATQSALAVRPVKSRHRWPVVAAVAAAVLVGAGLLPFLFPAKPGTVTVAEAPAEKTDDTVAVLMHTADAIWGESTVPTHSGAALPAGHIRLLSGVARLEFYCGATVILEGPADFQLISRTRAYCTEGQLRATVPPHAQGFTINTPNVDLVDRGTEFGLRVGGGKPTEVHVFKGKVDLYEAEAAERQAPQKSLTDGQGVRVNERGTASAIPTDPAGFVTEQKLDERMAEAVARREREWAVASAEWRRDPALRAHFDFQDAPPMGRVLANRGPKPPVGDGTIVGSAWTAGRWPGRKALEFKSVSDRVRINVPGEFEAVTLAAWVRIDGLPNINGSLMMTDGWEDGELHWQTNQDGTLVLGVQSTPKKKGSHYHAEKLITPDMFGQWIHLAVTYGGEGSQVRHYLDGRMVSEEATHNDLPVRIGEAELGNWNMAAHRNKTPIRHLKGCMDEFMLFTRALDPAEVAKLHSQGKPPG